MAPLAPARPWAALNASSARDVNAPGRPSISPGEKPALSSATCSASACSFGLFAGGADFLGPVWGRAIAIEAMARRARTDERRRADGKVAIRGQPSRTIPELTEQHKCREGLEIGDFSSVDHLSDLG